MGSSTPPMQTLYISPDGTLIDPDKARNVFLHSEQTRLADLNPFLLRKCLAFFTEDVSQVRKLRSGDLQVTTTSGKATRDLLKAKKFHTFDVVASLPRSLNSCRGVIHCRDLMTMEESDILEEMKHEGIMDVKFITRLDRERNMRVNTPLIVLTFNSTTLPDHVKVGYLQVAVRPYIPNPLRCNKCFRYGHLAKFCRSQTVVCGKCAGEHPTDSCSASVFQCVNCRTNNNHPSTSRDCPTFKIEKEICTEKVTSGISFYEARKRVMERQVNTTAHSGATSYASVVRKQVKTVETQTEDQLSGKETVLFAHTRPSKRSHIPSSPLPELPQGEISNQLVEEDMFMELCCSGKRLLSPLSSPDRVSGARHSSPTKAKKGRNRSR